MIKGKDLIGRLVVTANTGKTIGKVTDILHEVETGNVIGIKVDNEGLLTSGKVVMWSQIESIGEDAMIISSEADLIRETDDRKVEKVLKDEKVTEGTKLMTEGGKDLGEISDIAINEDGEVQGYFVTGGVIKDIYKGKAYVEAPDIIRHGQDVIFVPDEVANKVSAANGGIKSTSKNLNMDNAHKKLDKAWQETKEKAQNLKERAVSEWEEKRIKKILGLPTDRVVLNSNDQVIVEKGEVVTNEVVERARQSGVLDLLLNAANSSRNS